MTDLSVLASPAAALSVIVYFLIRDAILRRRNNHNPGNPINMEKLSGEHKVIGEKLDNLHEDMNDIKDLLK